MLSINKMNNSIQFPPSTVSSKLSSKLLKKPPSPIDWVHQSYMEMIQDVSYTTSHYYEPTENGSSVLEASVPESTTQQPQTETLDLNSRSSSDQQYKRATHSITPPLSLQRLFDSKSTSPPPCSTDYQRNRLKQVQEEEDVSSTEDEDDDDDDEFNTITTSSTDCNRKNNIYRFYREQQSLARPIDELDVEDPAMYKVMTPHSSNYGSGFASEHSESSIHITPSSPPPPPQQVKLVNQQQQIPKKKLKIIGKLITKMRIAAEKPFWSIDNHF